MFDGTTRPSAARWLLALVPVAVMAQQAPAPLAVPVQVAAPAAASPAAPPPAYPPRAAGNPAEIATGKVLFGTHCGFCHGAEAKGGETGPNLLRSVTMLQDQHGELLAPLLKLGRAQQGMPPFDLPADQVAAIAAYVHSFPVGRQANRGLLIDPVVGDAKAGEAYFNGAGGCRNCHSPSGDLSHIGSRHQPIPLQGAMMGGGRGARGGGGGSATHPVTATVTVSPTESVSGKLDYLDDFVIVVTDERGQRRSFERNGPKPAVTIRDPLQAHLQLLGRITDAQMHDLTAFLVTLK